MNTKQLLVLVFAVLLANTAFGQSALHLLIPDTRTVDDAPGASGYSQVIRADFKERSTIGVPGQNSYSTSLTITPWSDLTGNLVHQLNFNDGGLFYRTGVHSGDWNSWNRILTVNTDNCLAGPLDINGTLRAKEIKVTLNIGADFVFDANYQLKSLNEVQDFIKENKHLPEIPSAAEMTSGDTDLGVLQVKLLQKIEELTLYVIQQNDEIQSLKTKVNELENK
ncbi:hypothetical protein [Viscerimonas tarda]